MLFIWVMAVYDVITDVKITGKCDGTLVNVTKALRPILTCISSKSMTERYAFNIGNSQVKTV